MRSLLFSCRYGSLHRDEERCAAESLLISVSSRFGCHTQPLVIPFIIRSSFFIFIINWRVVLQFVSISSMQPSISFKNVSVTLGGVPVLKNISVDIPRGKIIGLLGPSGAGKTTLMRVIVGRQRVQKGSAEVLGLPAGSAKLRGRIGYMPQSAAVYPDLTVMENVRYFGAMIGADRHMVRQVIEMVDLNQQTKQIVATLSGGQRSRVSLAVALLGKPELLALDEPTVGVDPVLRQRLWKIFRSVATTGVTLYVSSHVMDEAERCDDLLLIRDGALLGHDSPEALRQQTHTSSVEAAFLALIGSQ